MADEIVIFDIDGTLADVSERIHHVGKKPKNWNAFFAGMAQDKAIHSMVRLCNILYASRLRILLCTGRSEAHRDETVQWLAEKGVDYHELILRRDATGAATRSSSVRCWRAWTRAGSFSLSRTAAGWSRCGARRDWSVCSAHRVSSRP
ncbi:MAG TPA: HAD family acid phosphatase [Anaerolineales bacterium]|nr:HAD family acid phosphatase [Anaerolineales bacterium]